MQILLCFLHIFSNGISKQPDRAAKVSVFGRVGLDPIRKGYGEKEVDTCNLNFCRYYLSLAHVASLFPGMFLVQEASSFPESCTTAILRSVNGVLAVLCSILVYQIIIHLRPTISERKATISAVVLALYPLHWFFTFLYYTDVAALTTVLAMYLASLKKRYWLSALVNDSAQAFFTTL